MRILMMFVLLTTLLLTACQALELPTGPNGAAFAVY